MYKFRSLEMHTWIYLQILRYKKFIASLNAHKKGIILYTSLTSFIIALFFKFMRKDKNKKKNLTKK